MKRKRKRGGVRRAEQVRKKGPPGNFPRAISKLSGGEFGKPPRFARDKPRRRNAARSFRSSGISHSKPCSRAPGNPVEWGYSWPWEGQECPLNANFTNSEGIGGMAWWCSSASLGASFTLQWARKAARNERLRRERRRARRARSSHHTRARGGSASQSLGLARASRSANPAQSGRICARRACVVDARSHWRALYAFCSWEGGDKGPQARAKRAPLMGVVFFLYRHENIGSRYTAGPRGSVF